MTIAVTYLGAIQSTELDNLTYDPNDDPVPAAVTEIGAVSVLVEELQTEGGDAETGEGGMISLAAPVPDRHERAVGGIASAGGEGGLAEAAGRGGLE